MEQAFTCSLAVVPQEKRDSGLSRFACFLMQTHVDSFSGFHCYIRP